MNKIRVDFNSLGKHGMVKANVRRAESAPAVGDEVLAVDPVEDMEYLATVDSIDETSGALWLVVAWEDVPAEDSLLSTFARPVQTFGAVTHLKITHSPVPSYEDTSNPSADLLPAAAG